MRLNLENGLGEGYIKVEEKLVNTQHYVDAKKFAFHKIFEN